MTEPLHEIAHISHAELLTPNPQESLRFFVDVLGMEIEAREGQSAFLRGWGDYQRYCLKLTESDTSGMAHMALRTWSPEALERRVAAVEAAGLGLGWSEGDVGHGPAYRCTDPDGHVFELLYETAEAEKIPFVVEVSRGSTSTDADAVYLSRHGIATGLVSVPLRYMHSPVETADLEDIERAVQLIVAFALRLDSGLDLAG